MPDKENPLLAALNILNLAAGLEPAVLTLIVGLMQGGQGKTAEQFLADADSTWDQVIATAKQQGAV